ncbi:MAG TPA: rhamnogalacturonan acetylesterase, partial [Pyrinomonadaceae bacterium]|nr:rhamnogalacturonan acetylesterase [Pyrinomonadaceae bacterium]
PRSLQPNLPTIFVVGDSTANNNANGARGWGDPFASYFDLTKINVINRARAGRSSRTFITEGLWDQVLADVKRGDYVLIQFGHNDGGPVDKERARGSLPGLGEEAQEVTMPDGRKEVVHTFGWYVRKMIAETRAKGATPILLSLTPRNIWKDNHVERTIGHFGEWIPEIAKSESVPFVDLAQIVVNKYEEMGEEKVKVMFATDHTHTSPLGAELNAASVVAGLKGLRNNPLGKYLSEKGEGVEAVAQQETSAAPKPRKPLPVPANPKLPTLFLIGDSTVRNGQGDGAGGQWGWGEPLVSYFDTTKINVVNRAVGGLSSRTYLTSGNWEQVLGMLKPGDFVIMQFGHNDAGALNDTSRARGTIRGTGEETEEIDNLLTNKHEVVHSYGWYLRKFIAEARAKGATPMVCSLVPRKIWKDGRIQRSADYAVWAAEVARTERVGFIPLNEIIARKYDELGEEKVNPLFGDEHTHTSWAGAELNAEAVVSGLKALRKNPLARYFSAKGKAVAKAKVEQAK